MFEVDLLSEAAASASFKLAVPAVVVQLKAHFLLGLTWPRLPLDGIRAGHRQKQLGPRVSYCILGQSLKGLRSQKRHVRKQPR